jgi:hypothetical protein
MLESVLDHGEVMYLPSNDTAVCLIGDLHCGLLSLKICECVHAKA